jgi:hypothetical protein
MQFTFVENSDYATPVLCEMVRVASPAAPIPVLDVPDAAIEQECIAVRRAAGAGLDPPQLYYPRAFFGDFARAHGKRARIVQQAVPDYANSVFRYNVLLEP